MALIENDHVIQTLSPDRADNSLDIRILPGRARRRDNLFNTQALYPGPKPLTIDTIAIAQQVAWSRVEGKSCHDLLSSPFRRRMVRRVEVNDLSAFITQNDKDIQDSEGRRRDGKEVYRYELRYMIIKESTPGLRRRLPMADHVFGDRGSGHTNAKHL